MQFEKTRNNKANNRRKYMKWWKKLAEQMVEDGIVDEEKQADLAEIFENYDLGAGTGQGAKAGKIDVNMDKVPDGMEETVSTLVDTVNTLKAQNKSLLETIEEEKEARQEELEKRKEEQQKKHEERVQNLVDKAIGDENNPGKLPESKKEWFKNFADKDPDAAEEWLENAPKDPRLANGDGDSSGDDEDEDKNKNKNPMLRKTGGVDRDILEHVQEVSAVE